MSEIWRLQIRFNNTSKNKIYRLFTHPRFRAAYDFMLIRSESDQFDKNLSLHGGQISLMQMNQQNKN